MRHTAKYLVKRYTFYLGGDQPPVIWTERLPCSCGVFMGLMLVLTIAKYSGESSGNSEWLMASLGVSAFLVFVLPVSPMVQPWAVIAENTLSALVGITTGNFISEPVLAMPIAAGLSTLGMFILRCLHPPAAAVALITVLGHVLQYRYALFPVMIDSVLLVLAGAIYSNMTGKQYPNHPAR